MASKIDVSDVPINNAENHKQEHNKLKDFVDNTSLHGARYINEKNPLRKLFWLVCLVAAFTYCVQQTVESIRNFNLRPYSTIIQMKQEKQQKFPAVSFCNLNMMHTGKYRDHVKKNFPNTSDIEIEADIKYMGRNLRRSIERTLAVNYSKFLPLNKNLINSTRMSSFYTIDTTKRSHLIHEMLLPKELFSCIYKFRSCNAEDFSPVDITPYGRCYTFEPRDRAVRLAGAGSGLHLMMNVGLNSYVNNGYPSKVGFAVVVHPDDTYPSVSEGFFTLPGAYTSCETRRKQFISLPFPYETACGTMKDWKYGKITYRRHLCIYECYLREIRRECNCSLEDTGSDGYPYCLTESQVNCNTDILESISENESFDNCRNSCPESCNYSEYQTRTSTSAINIKSLVQDTNELCGSGLKKNESICHEIRNKTEEEKYEYFRENIVMFEVYLKDNLYEENEQVPSYKGFALISNIGGNLGLFLGMSLLTITEIVEFAFITLWNKIWLNSKKVTVT